MYFINLHYFLEILNQKRKFKTREQWRADSGPTPRGVAWPSDLSGWCQPMTPVLGVHVVRGQRGRSRHGQHGLIGGVHVMRFALGASLWLGALA
jgi:hypothetical protein